MSRKKCDYQGCYQNARYRCPLENKQYCNDHKDIAFEEFVNREVIEKEPSGPANEAYESYARLMGCDSSDPDELDDWEDMGRDEIFKAGWGAALKHMRGES